MLIWISCTASCISSVWPDRNWSWLEFGLKKGLGLCFMGWHLVQPYFTQQINHIMRGKLSKDTTLSSHRSILVVVWTPSSKRCLCPISHSNWVLPSMEFKPLKCIIGLLDLIGTDFLIKISELESDIKTIDKPDNNVDIAPASGWNPEFTTTRLWAWIYSEWWSIYYCTVSSPHDRKIIWLLFIYLWVAKMYAWKYRILVSWMYFISQVSKEPMHSNWFLILK